MTVAIIDYGSGNLRSAAKAFERASQGNGQGSGQAVVVTSDADVVRRATRIVLPGVGAFADCAKGLIGLDGMVEALTEAVIVRGRPFLGICIGMQLMAVRGLEGEGADGLGWIEGEVRALRPGDPKLKVPHMGWNDMIIQNGGHAVLQGIDDGGHFYFVHGFQFDCPREDQILGRVDYGGPVTAMVGRDNMLGTQFHPEKSQALGLQLIENFMGWRP